MKTPDTPQHSTHIQRQHRWTKYSDQATLTYLLAWREGAEHDGKASSRSLCDGGRASLRDDAVHCSHPLVHVRDETLREGDTRECGETTGQTERGQGAVGKRMPPSNECSTDTERSGIGT